KGSAGGSAQREGENGASQKAVHVKFRVAAVQQASQILAGVFSARKAFASIVYPVVLLMLAGCGTLPARPEPPPSAARPPSPDSPLARIAAASSPSPELSGFRLMPLGVFSLDARIELADRARHTLDVQYYQLQNDATGRLLLRHLRDAAARGVRVRLLVDDLYTVGGDPLFSGLAAFDNIEVRLFNP